jgi:hypothetical protein
MQANQMKRKLEDNNNNNNDRPTKKLAMSNTTEELHNFFLVDELIEHILLNLLTKPKAVLNIAAVSKRHNRVVRSKAMWLRFGFSEKLSNDEIVPPTNLKFLLNCLRIDHIRRKSANELATLETYAYKYNNEIQYGISAMEDNSTPAIRQYLTNTKLTDKAFGAIYDILFKVGLIGHKIDITTFVDLILSSEEEIKREQKNRAEINQGSPIQYFPLGFSGSFTSELDDGTPYYTPLLWLAADDEGKHSCVSKRFINEDKFVIMAQGSSSFYFFKIDISRNLIEVCGELRTYLNYTQTGAFQTVLQRFDDKFAKLFEVPKIPRLGEIERSKLCMCHYDILSCLGGAEKVHNNIPLFKK